MDRQRKYHIDKIYRGLWNVESTLHNIFHRYELLSDEEYKLLVETYRKAGDLYRSFYSRNKEIINENNT